MIKTLIIFIAAAIIFTSGVYPQENVDVDDESLDCGWFCQLDRWLARTDSEVQGYVETGERSTLEDFEEDLDDTDYSYFKYRMKFSQDATEQIGYRIAGYVYDKDYDEADSLDNVSRTFTGGMDWRVWEGENRSLTLDLDLLLRDKQYFNSPVYEYERVKAAPGIMYRAEGLYTLKLRAGLDRYEYEEAPEKDQFIPFAKAEGRRYLMDRALTLSGSYSIKAAREPEKGRERIHRDIRAGADYKFGLTGIYKAMARAGWGNRDTRHDEEIDEDYDYEYFYWYVKTVHKVSDTVKTGLKYRFYTKDYLTGSLDHTGFSLRNGWDLEALDTSAHRLWWSIDLEHRDVEYDETDSGYRKDTVEAAVNYKRKKNYKLKAGLQANLYDYEDPSRDKTRYYTVLSGEKYLKEGDLMLGIHVKLRFTEYEERNDDDKSAVRVEGRYAF